MPKIIITSKNPVKVEAVKIAFLDLQKSLQSGKTNLKSSPLRI